MDKMVNKIIINITQIKYQNKNIKVKIKVIKNRDHL